MTLRPARGLPSSCFANRMRPAQVAKTGRPLTEKEVMEILPQVLDALKCVHDTGLWHLDMKPSNIMVDTTGRARLIDFGASKQLNTRTGGAYATSNVASTDRYAPLEQVEKSYDKMGAWSDIYSLGATLYSLLTQSTPPSSSDISDDMTADKGEAFALLAGRVSKKMRELIVWMMSPNRKRRPQTIDEVIMYVSMNLAGAEAVQGNASSSNNHGHTNARTQGSSTQNTSEETVIDDGSAEETAEDTTIDSGNTEEEEKLDFSDNGEDNESVRLDFLPVFSRVRLWIAILMALGGCVFVLLRNYIFYDNYDLRTNTSLFVASAGIGGLASIMHSGLKRIDPCGLHSFVPITLFLFFVYGIALYWDGIITTILGFIFIIVYGLTSLCFLAYEGRMQKVASCWLLHSLMLLVMNILFCFAGGRYWFFEYISDPAWEAGIYLYPLDFFFAPLFITLCVVSWFLLQTDSEYYDSENVGDDYYEGYYKDGKFDGLGLYKWANGGEYRGRFKHGEFSGDGLLTYAAGKERYKGKFRHDKRHGRGKYYYSNHTYQEGIWDRGELVKVTEEGTW